MFTKLSHDVAMQIISDEHLKIRIPILKSVSECQATNEGE